MLAVSKQSWNPGESPNKLEKWDIEEGKCWGRQDAVGSGTWEVGLWKQWGHLVPLEKKEGGASRDECMRRADDRRWGRSAGCALSDSGKCTERGQSKVSEGATLKNAAGCQQKWKPIRVLRGAREFVAWPISTFWPWLVGLVKYLDRGRTGSVLDEACGGHARGKQAIRGGEEGQKETFTAERWETYWVTGCTCWHNNHDITLQSCKVGKWWSILHSMKGFFMLREKSTLGFFPWLIVYLKYNLPDRNSICKHFSGAHLLSIARVAPLFSFCRRYSQGGAQPGAWEIGSFLRPCRCGFGWPFTLWCMPFIHKTKRMKPVCLSDEDPFTQGWSRTWAQ